MTTIPKNTPVFFKKKAITEDTKPDATFLRDMNCILDGQPVMQIHWHGEDWTIRRSEMLTQPEALRQLALEHQKTINAAKSQVVPETPTQERVAAKMGISTSTLSKRYQLIKNHLPQVKPL